jgi:hypothetical protein
MDETMEDLIEALRKIKREAAKNKPNPDRIYALAESAIIAAGPAHKPGATHRRNE